MVQYMNRDCVVQEILFHTRTQSHGLGGWLRLEEKFKISLGKKNMPTHSPRLKIGWVCTFLLLPITFLHIWYNGTTESEDKPPINAMSLPSSINHNRIP